jgi:hypothetical protein
MTLVLCWLVFPLVLALVAGGCGLLVQAATGFDLPGALLLPLGLALAIVTADLATMSGATARLATPAVLALAVAGYGVSYPWRGRRIDGWAAGAALAVFAVYAAPVVLSGSASFAGFITLDDTATWLALTDRALEHGRTLSGLPPSTYQQVLADYLGGGYPLGAFLPLGIGGKLTGQDIAWLFQPTIAFYGAMLGLAIYAVSGRLVTSKLLRAVVAFLGAQPALLFAYSLWSGIKEVGASALIALVCAAVATTIDRWRSLRATVPAAIAVAGLLAILSPAGGIWLIAPAVVVLVALVRRGLASSLRAVAGLVVLVLLLSIPSLAIARSFISGASGGEITSSNEVANLGHPLDTLQAFGIWPATDFRSPPHDTTVTHVLIGVLLLGVVLSLVLAWRRRVLGMPLYLITGGVGVLLIFVLDQIGLSSPWLNAKGMAEGSPALVAAGVAGAVALIETGRRTEGALIGAAIAAGVLWSNGLAYSNAWIAPRGPLAELQAVGNRFAGQGPTLTTDTHPYGTRHFLRKMDTESPSERRRRLIPLLNGRSIATGIYGDLDRFQVGGILDYKTLVLPRSPVASYPSSPYQLVWSGRYYTVWQRPDAFPAVAEHLPLGSALQPGAVPRCSEVLRLARRVGSSGRLAAAVRRPVVVVNLSSATRPSRWASDGDGLLYPNSEGDVRTTVNVGGSSTYEVWLGGSFRDRLRLAVDGRQLADRRYRLNGSGDWTPLGRISLAPGSHPITLGVGGPGLRPGSGGYPYGMGPLVLSPTTAADGAVTSVAASDARSLCGKRLDWVEGLAS